VADAEFLDGLLDRLTGGHRMAGRYRAAVARGLQDTRSSNELPDRAFLAWMLDTLHAPIGVKITREQGK
jgi:hypothetical protein